MATPRTQYPRISAEHQFFRKSGNGNTLEAIKQGLGIVGADQVYDDLDDLVGTWQPDDAFDQAIEDQDTVDANIWR